MESAGDFVCGVFLLELSTGVEFGEHNFDRGFAVDCGVVVFDGISWDSSAVIGDSD